MNTPLSKPKLKENPELLLELESQLSDISGAVRRLLAGPIKRRAILVLLEDMLPTTTGIGIKDIDTVISSIESLDTQYLKQKIKR